MAVKRIFLVLIYYPRRHLGLAVPFKKMSYLHANTNCLIVYWKNNDHKYRSCLLASDELLAF